MRICYDVINSLRYFISFQSVKTTNVFDKKSKFCVGKGGKREKRREKDRFTGMLSSAGY